MSTPVWIIIAIVAVEIAAAAIWIWNAKRSERRAAEIRHRFNPKRTVPSSGIVYVDHEPTVSAMRENGL